MSYEHLKQWSARIVSLNKVLLEHSYPHLFTYCFWQAAFLLPQHGWVVATESFRPRTRKYLRFGPWGRCWSPGRPLGCLPTSGCVLIPSCVRASGEWMRNGLGKTLGKNCEGVCALEELFSSLMWEGQPKLTSSGPFWLPLSLFLWQLSLSTWRAILWMRH